MKRIYLIGAGPGNMELLTTEAKKAMIDSDVIIAHKRLLMGFENSNKKLIESTSPKEITDYIAQAAEDKTISVLVSGDTGFYSLSKSLVKTLEGMGDVKVLCGISSIQYFCSKIQSSWDDALLISLHGRDCNLVEKVKRNPKVITLAGGEYSPQYIVKLLCENHLENVILTIGENLSYQNEKITMGTAKELLDTTFSSLCVMQIENPNPKDHVFINDDAFVRGDTPMTKQEIRCISISKLQLEKKDIVFDIGAGTGSVAVEMALQIPDGKVFAIEKEADGIELIKENKQKFSVTNLEMLQGNAKDMISDLPTPDKAFIGGSGGALIEILDSLYCKNPNIRIVINAITLETLCAITNYYKNRNEYLFELINVSVSFARKAGNYNLFTGQNPVYIITVSRKDSSDEM